MLLQDQKGGILDMKSHPPSSFSSFSLLLVRLEGTRELAMGGLDEGERTNLLDYSVALWETAIESEKGRKWLKERVKCLQFFLA